LYSSISKYRNRLFSYLAQRAAVALLDPYTPTARGNVGRFQSFAQIANSLVEFTEEGKALRQWEIAKNVSVSDDINLVSAIECWFDKHRESAILEGGSTRLIQQLRGLGERFEHSIPTTGQAFARDLREQRGALESLGYIITKRRSDDTNYYKIVKSK